VQDEGHIRSAGLSGIGHGSAHAHANTSQCLNKMTYIGSTDLYQPGIPSASTAKSQLAALTVKASSDGSGYDRDLFPTWDTISGTCNTR